jgi:H+-transporting ATPase
VAERTIIPVDEVEEKSLEELFSQLDSAPEGLSRNEAESRLKDYGPNSIEEEKANPLLKFLRYFWGPISWMIEVAAVLSAIVQHWSDLIIILILLLFNALVTFWQEHKADNALEALKQKLALKAQVAGNCCRPTCPRGYYPFSPGGNHSSGRQAFRRRLSQC